MYNMSYKITICLACQYVQGSYDRSSNASYCCFDTYGVMGHIEVITQINGYSCNNISSMDIFEVSRFS